jgi:hypothetical protein
VATDGRGKRGPGPNLRGGPLGTPLLLLGLLLLLLKVRPVLGVVPTSVGVFCTAVTAVTGSCTALLTPSLLPSLLPLLVVQLPSLPPSLLLLLLPPLLPKAACCCWGGFAL